MTITSDIHIHTSLSDCAQRDASVQKYIEYAERDGLHVLGFSNHLWDDTVTEPTNWYRPQNVAHVLQLRKELEILQKSTAIKLLFGCETEFISNGTLCLSAEHFSLFDYVLIPHGHTHIKEVMPPEYKDDFPKHARFLMDSFLRIVEHPLTPRAVSVAHPFAAGVRHHTFNEIQALIPDSYFYEAFSAAKERGIALEINGSCLIYLPEKEIPHCEYVRIYSIAKACGCRFTYGSDSHDFRTVRRLPAVERFFEQCGITDGDILSEKELLKSPRMS